MDDPTITNKIISGKATVIETDNPTIIMRKVIVPDKNLTLDGLMESWKFSPGLKERCIVMCANYVQGPENFSRCLDLMDYLAQSDSSKEHFPGIAPHLPAVFSLPTQNQEELLIVIRKNISEGNFPSAYKCILETHEESIRARVYSGLERLGLTQSELDDQYIWNSLNSVFTGYSFLQNMPFEDQDESQELARRIDFLEQIVPHYLDEVKLIPAYLVAEKPAEAKAIARRIAMEYATFHDEKSLEEVFERVTKYTRHKIEKESKKVQREGEKNESGGEDEPESPSILVGNQTPQEHIGGVVAENDTLRERYSREQEIRLTEIRNKVSEYINLNQQLTEANVRLEEQINASAEEAAALRKQYAEFISPTAHRAALESEARDLRTRYEGYISYKEYCQKVGEWNATKKKLEETVKEAKKASAPSGSGRWKLAAALGALGVSLAAGGVLYFFEARQNEELTKRVDKLNIGNLECVKANESLYQEGKELMEKIKFYEKQSCAKYTE